MKKNTVLTALLLCLALMIAAFASCGEQTESKGAGETEETLSETDKTTAISAAFHELGDLPAYLDGIGFKQGLYQGSFLSLVGAYRYEGVGILESPAGGHLLQFDGANGGGCQMTGELFGLSNSNFLIDGAENAPYVEETNRFFTTVALDGLTLPFGIGFSEPLTTVLGKLSLDLDLENGFVSDPGQTGVTTLYESGTATLKLNDLLLKYTGSEKTSGKPLYDYTLEYAETFTCPRSDGRTSTVTRNLVLSFDDENRALARVEISVKERYGQKSEAEAPLAVGMSYAEVDALMVEHLCLVDYVFCKNAAGDSVVGQFDSETGNLKTVRTFPAVTGNAAAFAALTPGMTVFEVVERVGLPLGSRTFGILSLDFSCSDGNEYRIAWVSDMTVLEVTLASY